MAMTSFRNLSMTTKVEPQPTWTEKEADSLESLWEWGHTSTCISKMLGRYTRNAVMGRIRRQGLMGRQGIRINACYRGAQIPMDILETAAREMLDGDNVQAHVNAMVTLAALHVGQDAATIANATGMDVDKVAHALTLLHDTRAWKKGDRPPAHWWHHEEATMAFILDMMVASGLITFKEDESGERLYASIERSRHP